MSKQKIDIELHESASNFLEYLHTIKNKSEGTIIVYEGTLREFLRYIVKANNKRKVTDKLLKDLTLNDLNKYIIYTEKELNNKPATRARKVACLQSYFKYLYKQEKIISENIAEDLQSPKIPDKEVVYLDKEQSKKLLDSLFKYDKFYKRDYCILTMFLNTGLRVSELCELKLSMIKGDKLVIIGKGQKMRELFLNTDCLKAINDYLEIRDEEGVREEDKQYLFLSRFKKKMEKITIQKMVKRCLQKAGFGDEYHTHSLRASFATNVYNNGVVGIQTV
jgi:site-specific recombinase XerD